MLCSLLLIFSSLVAAEPVASKDAMAVYQTEFSLGSFNGTAVAGEVIQLLQWTPKETLSQAVIDQRLDARLKKLLEIYRDQPTAKKGYDLIREKFEGMHAEARLQLSQRMEVGVNDGLEELRMMEAITDEQCRAEKVALRWGKLYSLLIEREFFAKKREDLAGPILDEVAALAQLDRDRVELYKRLREEITADKQ